MNKLKAALKEIVGFVLRMFLVFVVIEGLCSVWLIGSRGTQTVGHVQAGGKNAQFDADIGWVNIPNFNQRDLYGPGGHTRMNSRGFRNAEELDAKVPEGKLRILCSGDSFTFGYGVDNDHANCNLLAGEDARLQTVNMGVPGYGIDQMYLLYKRDGLKLDHDIHVISVIREDFKRMSDSKFLNANKPFIRQKDGALVVGGVPVQKAGYSMTGLTGTISAFESSRVATVYRTFFPQKTNTVVYRNFGPLMDTAIAIFGDLGRIAEQRKATFVVVYLPMADDMEDAPLNQSLLAAELAKKNLPFFDLTPDFKALPFPERTALFIPKSAKNEQFAAGHYSAAGNLFVAKALWKRISALPAVADKLSHLGQAAVPPPAPAPN
jgi:hypothetical protein